MVVHYNPEDSQEESVLRDYLAKGPNPRTAIGALKNPYKESKIKGIPSIFYAVYSRNPVKVEKWLKEGADPNAVAKLEDPFLLGDDNQYPFEVEIPVLIFAILLGEPKIVSILLSFNSNPVSVPKEMRLPFVEPEIFKSKTEEELKDTFITKVLENPELKWCNDVMFEQLRRTLNLSMRYYLHRGDSFKVTQRYRQMAKSPAFDFQPLFRAQFDLIGQEHALKGIFMKMLLVSEKQSAGRANKPVVLMFAGKSTYVCVLDSVDLNDCSTQDPAATAKPRWQGKWATTSAFHSIQRTWPSSSASPSCLAHTAGIVVMGRDPR